MTTVKPTWDIVRERALTRTMPLVVTDHAGLHLAPLLIVGHNDMDARGAGHVGWGVVPAGVAPPSPPPLWAQTHGPHGAFSGKSRSPHVGEQDQRKTHPWQYD